MQPRPWGATTKLHLHCTARSLGGAGSRSGPALQLGHWTPSGRHRRATLLSWPPWVDVGRPGSDRGEQPSGGMPLSLHAMPFGLHAMPFDRHSTPLQLPATRLSDPATRFNDPTTPLHDPATPIDEHITPCDEHATGFDDLVIAFDEPVALLERPEESLPGEAQSRRTPQIPLRTSQYSNNICS